MLTYAHIRPCFTMTALDGIMQKQKRFFKYSIEPNHIQEHVPHKMSNIDVQTAIARATHKRLLS
jgi:hypothetical protein